MAKALYYLKARLSRLLRLIDEGDPVRLAAFAIGIGFALTLVVVLSFVPSSREPTNVQEVGSVVAGVGKEGFTEPEPLTNGSGKTVRVIKLQYAGIHFREDAKSKFAQFYEQCSESWHRALIRHVEQHGWSPSAIEVEGVDPLALYYMVTASKGDREVTQRVKLDWTIGEVTPLLYSFFRYDGMTVIEIEDHLRRQWRTPEESRKHTQRINELLGLDETTFLALEAFNAPSDKREPDIDKVISNLRYTESKVQGTGVKQSVLLAIMNANPPELEERFHHEFVYDSRREFPDGDDVIIYKDMRSPLYLLMLEPPDDLTLIELVISLEELVTTDEDGEVSGEAAAAFGRCVQRMTMAVDPSWTEELYEWMNERLAIALFTEHGAKTNRRGLIVNFDRQKISESRSILCFAIVPE